MVVQLQHRTGIFGCHEYSIFSDGKLSLGMGPWGPVEAVSIPGAAAWHAPIPGSSELVWHNTGVFARAWSRIYKDGAFRRHHWTIKVDPDTAFLPGVLQRRLQEQTWLDPEVPMYLLNCQKWHSFQGPLEVLSRGAADKLFGSYTQCQASLQWKEWGEDWFVSNCLNFLGVQNREGFELLDDMWCGSEYSHTGRTYEEETKAKGGPVCTDGKPAFHPYKTTEDLKTCLLQVLRL